MKKLSIILPVKGGSHFIADSVRKLNAFLMNHWQNDFEIVVSVNGTTEEIESAYLALKDLEKDISSLICHRHWAPAGKGAALQSAYLKTSGEMVGFIDADLPYNLDFFPQAAKKIEEGADYVTGNRRLPLSRFDIPIPLLSLAYGRHRLGLAFNSIVRSLFSLETLDTQAGIKLISRPLAEAFFSRQRCPGFLFDLELFLVAKHHGLNHCELPIMLHLNFEKSTIRIFREIVMIQRWLRKIKAFERRGEYGPAQVDIKHHIFAADDWGISAETNSAILELAQVGLVKRVSVLANGLHVSDFLDQLRQLPGIEIGFHFNLTYGRPLTRGLKELVDERGCFFSLKELLKKLSISSPKSSILAEIQQEFDSQYEKLVQLKICPTYMDGHHHIHLAPKVLPACRDSLRKHHIHKSRLPLDRRLLWSSKFPIYLLAKRAQKFFQDENIESLPCYYPSEGDFSSIRDFCRPLQNSTPHEVIVHPARIGDLVTLPQEFQDPYNGERVQEYWFLKRLASSSDRRRLR